MIMPAPWRYDLSKVLKNPDLRPVKKVPDARRAVIVTRGRGPCS